MDVLATRMAGRALRPDGFYSPGGLIALRELLSADADASAFSAWRGNPLTEAFVSALRDLALQPAPAMLDCSEIPVQYGVTCGLQIAARLLDDPTAVVPGVLGTRRDQAPLEPPQYLGDPMQALDRMAGIAQGEPA